MSERLLELRIENNNLKTQIENLEKKIVNIVGMFNIESSGEAKSKNLLNEKILNFIHSTTDQLNIVTPKVDQFYTTELKKATEKEIPVLLIMRDRRLQDKSYKKTYDDLNSTQGITVINNPNVFYLLLFNSEQAIYSGGSLDKEELSNSVLIITTIKETQNMRKIAKIFTSMLPSFLRT